MTVSSKVVYLDDLEERGDDDMEFRLTYEGPLLARQSDGLPHQSIKPSKLANQHDIRVHFHRQLRRLWDTTPFLRDATVLDNGALVLDSGGGPDAAPIHRQSLAHKHSHYGHQFVPLVADDLKLRCDLEVLLLRADMPDRTPWGGDIDNRIKTLLDALRIPEAKENYAGLTLGADLQPMYCLMEDDKLISKLSVETDQLLDADGTDRGKVALVITVRIRPYSVIWRNLNFV